MIVTVATRRGKNFPSRPSSSLVSSIVLSSPISSPAGSCGAATAEAVQIKQPPEISLAAFVAL